MIQVTSLDVVYESAVQISIMHSQRRVYSSYELAQTTPKRQQNKLFIRINNQNLRSESRRLGTSIARTSCFKLTFVDA